MTIAQPLKVHGGKRYLAKQIVALMPDHLHYVEPYAGGLAVLLAKDPEDVSEVVNDIDTNLTNFWQVLQNDTLWSIFSRRLNATPFGEHFWNCTEWQLADPDNLFDADVAGRSVNRAIAFFIRCRQSLAGRMKDFATLSRNRVRRNMNEQASAWLTAVEGLPAVHARLKRVVILNRDALDVIRQQDGDKTLYYLDPPYLHSTRAAGSRDVYAHEMTDQQHADLLDVLSTIKGKFLLSGYRCQLYDDAASKHGWTRHDFSMSNHAAGGATKRAVTESVWGNF